MSDEGQGDERTAADRIAYVRNGRPVFFDDPVNDKLLAMLMVLLGEVCVCCATGSIRTSGSPKHTACGRSTM
jgi:hypothetical protein